jgi:outer membrane protein OmpA-like peptidoglycan-associated protein
MRRSPQDVCRERGPFRPWAIWTSLLALSTCVALVVLPAGQSVTGASTLSISVTAALHLSAHNSSSDITVPNGTPDSSEPSGEAPPGPRAMPGYAESYVTDFTGTTVPSGWDVYTGQPGGDPGAQWGLSHVVVSGGLLQLNTWQDPAYGGEWVAGGLCQCGVVHTYGAYFVRSRLTGPGPTQVELLWPTSGWPPEVDFDETFGPTDLSMATLHWSSANSQTHNAIYTDMTQWNTWGVIWTPTSVAYTLNGRVWAQVDVASEVPHQPMTLDIQQQTWCDVAANPLTPSTCPTTPQSTLVDWVAEYQATGTSVAATLSSSTAKAVTLRPFAANSAVLSPLLKRQIADLAHQIVASNDSMVLLTGYSDSAASASAALAVSRERAIRVSQYLRQVLHNLNVTGVSISVTGDGSVKPVGSNSTVTGRADNRRVVANIS